jgi:hypothetical protein
VVHQLAKAGYLKAKSRRGIDGYHTSKFDHDAAEKLLKTIGEPPIGSKIQGSNPDPREAIRRALPKS